MEQVAITTSQVVLTNQDTPPDSVVLSDTEVVVVNNETIGVVVAGVMGPPGKDGNDKISLASDVDVSNLVDGSLLIYNSSTLLWEATKTLDKQVLEAGQF